MIEGHDHVLQILQNKSKKHLTILLVILVLSAYVHLWNPIGFPDFFFDEGVYMRRAMNVLETGNPQEGYLYDHPYFGQLILAGFLKITGFPQNVEQSLELSYLIPRLLMGAFAVLDTFLVYKITEKKFGKRTAILASVLFGLMPITWMLRRILLDTILLPFLLSSILLALHSKDSKNRNILILGSAALLGLSIFTKITVVTMIPVVGYIIFSNSKNPRDLIKWLPPVFLIPLVWPAISLYLGQLNFWFKDVFWQAGRNTGGFFSVTAYLFDIDVVTMMLGFAGVAYAVYARNLFLIFWFVPFLIFVNSVGFFQYFHYILILPVLCTSAAFMIQNNLEKIKNLKLQNYCFSVIAIGIVIFGLTVTSILINTDVTSEQFEVIKFSHANFDDSDTTLLASPVYSWIFSDIYDKENILLDYSSILFEPIRTEKTMLIADPHFMADLDRGKKLQIVYDKLDTIHEFSSDIKKIDTNAFPYGSIKVTGEGRFIELKTGRVQP